MVSGHQDINSQIMGWHPTFGVDTLTWEFLDPPLKNIYIHWQPFLQLKFLALLISIHGKLNFQKLLIPEPGTTFSFISNINNVKEDCFCVSFVLIHLFNNSIVFNFFKTYDDSLRLHLINPQPMTYVR